MNSRTLQGWVYGVAALGLALGSGFAQDQEDALALDGPKTPGTVVKASGAIVIDGRLDDAAWEQAKPIAANFVWGKKNVVSPEPRMIVRYLWDDAYLYIGYEVFDTNLVAVGNGVTDGPPDNRRTGCEMAATNKPVDVVEFFIVFDDRNLFWELQHNASNQFNDGLCIVSLPSWQKIKIAFAHRGVYWAWGEHVQDEGDRTLACAVSLRSRTDGTPSTVNEDGDEDTGYTGELRLPWYGIGAPAVAQTREGEKPGPWNMAGREISILAVFQNGDTPEHYFTSCSGTTREFFHHQTEHFPRYVIRGFEPWAW